MLEADYYATPQELVALMVGTVGGGGFNVILDPAAGDGRLVRAAERRWPDARAVAIELDHERAAALTGAHASWTVLSSDFLTVDLRPRTVAEGPVLALLNPPFSGRGARTVSVDWPAGSVTRCGRAMAFLLKAASLVDCVGGEIVAIVPSGLLTNRRDGIAREHLTSRGTLTVVRDIPRHAFRGAAATTAVVRWVPKGGLPSASDARAVRPALRELRVVRGALPVHKARQDLSSGGSVPYLHTTSVSADRGVAPVLWITPRACERVVSPPCVLVPRVGQPAVDKVVVYDGPPAVLSDCLYGVECGTVEEAVGLRQALLGNWAVLCACYGGSCAPFLRVDDLLMVLAESAGVYSAGSASVNAVAALTG
jgi:hypothetical protein